MMEVIVEECVSPADLKKFEKIYIEQFQRGPVSDKAQFDYAWCLVRSKLSPDMRQGLALLEELFRKTSDESAKRDYLYYMAVGTTRLKEYEKALKYTKAILEVQPGNHQAAQLQTYINQKMKKDGLIGMAIVAGGVAVGVGAAALAVGGLVGLALAKAVKK